MLHVVMLIILQLLGYLLSVISASRAWTVNLPVQLGIECLFAYLDHSVSIRWPVSEPSCAVGICGVRRMLILVVLFAILVTTTGLVCLA